MAYCRDCRLVVAFCLWFTASTIPAFAQEDVASFYKGKQVRIVVGSAPATGLDLIARVLARHMGSKIPGSPSVIVQNVPGAGGLIMTNQLYNSAPRDGTVIGAPFNGVPMAPLLEPNASRFDAARLNWLGSTNREAYVAFAWHTAPVQSLNDLLTNELVVGGAGQGGAMVDFPLASSRILGLKFKVVRGYEGSAQVNHAIERGEIQGQGGIGWAAVKAQTPHWIAEKKIKVIAQYGFDRHPDLPDVPTVLELAKNKFDHQALRILFSRQEYGRPYFLPPDIPTPRLQAMRRAFDATMIDPNFIADVAKLQLDVDPMTGEDMQTLVGGLTSTPPDIVTRLRSALSTQADK